MAVKIGAENPGNRLDLSRRPNCFDQRLRSTHVIHAALYLYPGAWRGADGPGVARSDGIPPIAFITDRHPGRLPADLDVLYRDTPRSNTGR